jgi:hypothetical protein
MQKGFEAALERTKSRLDEQREELLRKIPHPMKMIPKMEKVKVRKIPQ